MFESEEDPDLVRVLARLLNRLDVGLDTVVLIGECISAHARFSLWMLKIKREGTADEFMKIMDDEEPILVRCCAAAREGKGLLNREELQAAIRDATRFYTQIVHRDFERKAVAKE